MLRVMMPLILIAVCSSAFAQEDLRQGNADYPVPLPAALAALETRSLAILEPLTVRSISAATQASWSTDTRAGSLTAGAEFAPFLIGNSVNLSEYLSGRLIRVLLRTRISLAAEPGDGSLNTALGLRWMLHDDADLRADSLFQRMLLSWARENPSLAARCSSSADPVSCYTESLSRSDYIRPKIDSLRRAMKDSLWNRSVVEMAFAAVYSSTSQFTAIRHYQAFLSGGFPVLGRSGQFVLGLSGRAGFSRNGDARQGTVSARLYYGTAPERIFAGIRLAASDLQEPDYRAEAGALFRLGGGFWLRPTLDISLLYRSGYQAGSSFNLSYAIPETGTR